MATGDHLTGRFRSRGRATELDGAARDDSSWMTDATMDDGTRYVKEMHSDNIF